MVNDYGQHVDQPSAARRHFGRFCLWASASGQAMKRPISYRR